MSDKQRYATAAHAMQTGVSYTLARDPTSGTPKHLRVGVNAAHADLGSLARLLIAKGIITEAEYLAALADGMEREAKSYEAAISGVVGTPVTLA